MDNFFNENKWNDKGWFMGNVTVANQEMAKLDGGFVQIGSD